MGSMSAAAIEPPQVRWDLSVLFAGIDDPKIEATWAEIDRRAKAFAETYRGKINSESLTAETLGAAIRECEEISVLASKPANFASLLFAANTADPALGAFMQKQNERITKVSVDLLFFELELQAAPSAVIDRLLESDTLAPYRHYVRNSRAFSPYRLSEKEEIILEETATTGSQAWVRYFDEFVSNLEFTYLAPCTETPETLTEQEVLALLRNADREVRQAAADSLSAGLTGASRTLVFVYNNLLQDKATEDRLRGFEFPQQARHLVNELKPSTVELVMRLCAEHGEQVARFYRVKREILGLEKLTHIDRYAPLFEAEGEIDFARAREIVLKAFRRFSEGMADRAQEFFDEGWIDAEPRKGKRGGAFCSYLTPDTHPVVFQSYMNKMDDVMTLAHELGHGVHASLSRAQTYFNFHGTLPLAELASTFGEMLVFEDVVSQASERDRLALYAEKIEGIFATVYRQAAMYRFESKAHALRRAEGELSAEKFGELWHTEMQAMFGDSVELGEQHRDWWSYIPHFIHTPFYVYAYSFGELLVLSLYQMAKEEGPGFERKYVDMLTLGGSRTPAELMALVGVDLESEAFWLGGFKVLEGLIEEFERLWQAVKSS